MANPFAVQAVVRGQFGLPRNEAATVNWATEDGAIDVVAHLSTTYREDGRASETAIDLELSANSLDDAWHLGANYGAFFAPIMAIVANAPFKAASVTKAVSRAPGRLERVLRIEHSAPFVLEWFERCREVSPELVVAVAAALARARHFGRIHRSLVHYNDALLAWREAESMRAVYALTHAAELLADVTVKVARESQGRDELARAWEVVGQSCECGARRLTDGDLRAGARRSVILQGDAEAVRAWQSVRNPLAHGHRDFPTIHAAAVPVRERLASLVRTAILDQLSLSPATRKEIQQCFAKPLEQGPPEATVEVLLECQEDGVWDRDTGWVDTETSITVGDLSYGRDGKMNGDVQLELTSRAPRGGGSVRGNAVGARSGFRPTGESRLVVLRGDGTREAFDSSDSDWTVEPGKLSELIGDNSDTPAPVSGDGLVEEGGGSAEEGGVHGL